MSGNNRFRKRKMVQWGDRRRNQSFKVKESNRHPEHYHQIYLQRMFLRNKSPLVNTLHVKTMLLKRFQMSTQWIQVYYCVCENTTVFVKILFHSQTKCFLFLVKKCLRTTDLHVYNVASLTTSLEWQGEMALQSILEQGRCEAQINPSVFVVHASLGSTQALLEFRERWTETHHNQSLVE